MKNIIVAFVLLISSSAFAENFVLGNKVPQNISSRFQYQFPGAKDVSWEKNDESYTASYLESGKKIHVYYTSKGDCVEIDREIAVGELPNLYKNMITNHLNSDVQFEHITAIDDFSGSPFYVIEVLKNNKKYTYELSAAHSADTILYDLRQGAVIW